MHERRKNPDGIASGKLTCNVSRAARFLAAFALLVLLVRPPVLHALAVTNHPFVGVTHVVRREDAPRPMSMNVVLIDLTAPGIRFKVTRPAGTRDTVRQRTLDFLEAEGVQIAINCHFFLPFPSVDPNVNLVGLAAWRGRIYSAFEPQPIAPYFRDQSYAILPYAPAINIGRGNRVTIVHRDPASRDGKRALEPVRIWNAVAGSAQIVAGGAVALPSYSGSPGGLNPLNGYSDFDSWYGRLRARTAIGLSADARTLVLFTVDEASGSYGMTVEEVASLLVRDYDVADALNMDGGGSTTLAMRDPTTRQSRLMNVSSDSPLGRAVGSNLGIYARPLATGRQMRR